MLSFPAPLETPDEPLMRFALLSARIPYIDLPGDVLQSPLTASQRPHAAVPAGRRLVPSLRFPRQQIDITLTVNGVQ